MATLHLRALYKNNSFSYVAILISCQHRLKKSILNNLGSVATGLLEYSFYIKGLEQQQAGNAFMLYKSVVLIHQQI
jgi:hypothetical protein